MYKIKIGKYHISNKSDPFIIAEIGANHNGNIDTAIKLINAAYGCGCHCVKFQSWSKESLFSKSVYSNNNQLEKEIEKYSLSLKQFYHLKKYCDKKKIIFSTSVFSRKEVDFFVNIDIDFIKIASMDVNNYSFLEYVSKKNLPIILATGLSSFDEINTAVKVITRYNHKIVLLHCISLYPPKDDQVNLNNIEMLVDKFNYPVGFSDHTEGIAIPLASVAKGACVIEKHFTLDKNEDGWDHKISADPFEMKAIVDGSKRIRKALGSKKRIISREEKLQRKVFRRSIVAARDIKKGSRIVLNDLDFKRPGIGLEPNMSYLIIGKMAKKNILKDNLLFLDDFE